MEKEAEGKCLKVFAETVGDEPEPAEGKKASILPPHDLQLELSSRL